MEMGVRRQSSWCLRFEVLAGEARTLLPSRVVVWIRRQRSLSLHLEVVVRTLRQEILYPHSEVIDIGPGLLHQLVDTCGRSLVLQQVARGDRQGLVVLRDCLPSSSLLGVHDDGKKLGRQELRMLVCQTFFLEGTEKLEVKGEIAEVDAGNVFPCTRTSSLIYRL